MNIFALDRDPIVSAQMMCNKHVVKMIVESAQLLCTAHWVNYLKFDPHDYSDPTPSMSDFPNQKSAKLWLQENMPVELQPPYRMTHVNHPSAIWARASEQNYAWLTRHMRGLLTEYNKRYQKIHKSNSVWLWLRINKPVKWPTTGLTHIPLCMPDYVRDKYNDEDFVLAYREYYIKEKNKMAVWRPRAEPPTWWNENA